MGLKKSPEIRNAHLDAEEATIGTTPIIRLLQQPNALPVDTVAAQTGTLIGTITLPTDWMAAAALGSKAKIGSWQVTATSTGELNYWRFYNSAGTICHYQGPFARPHTVSLAYTVGQRVTNAGNLYRCTTAGTTGAATPPTGTTTFNDGSVVWTYEDDTGGVMVIDSFAVSAGQTITISTFTITAANG